MIFIELKNLALQISIGIHDFERTAPQPYSITIRMHLDDDYQPMNLIANAVDYQKTRQAAIDIALRQHFDLHETLIEELLEMCFSLDDRVCRVAVEGRKTAIFDDCEAVGLSYEFTRPEYAEFRRRLLARSTCPC